MTVPDDGTTALDAHWGAGDALVRGGGRRLPEQIAARLARRIEEHALQPGTRLASIREFAQREGVSRSTVVEAYDRLVATGHVESRRGAGFFIRGRPERWSSRASTVPGGAAAVPPREAASLDVAWLMRSLFAQAPAEGHPGAGLLPSAWLESAQLGAAIRTVGRGTASGVLGYGVAAGFLPLREQIARRLAQIDVAAAPDQIVVTSGATHALDLVARLLAGPGDTVLVEDPAWFVLFGRFAAFGLNVLGVPRTPEGPDLDVLATLLERHQPKLFVLSSVLHNPTGTLVSPAVAHRLLQIAERHDCTIVDDDIYGDLAPPQALRLASLDQLRRVVHVGGYSKTLAAGLRVGYLAARRDLADRLADLKLLTGLTSPELGERVVARILAEGHYRRHVDRLRGRLDAARDRTLRALQRFGARPFAAPQGGMFLWVDCGRDTRAIAARAAAQGILCAPGGLFSPRQQPSTWMRVAAATCLNPAAMRFLERELGG
ncbi:MAG TPA: PLP-dependent aminotransferase family protein [Burkholderiaceae bacterium]|nr:PLP-dependent aminotransferase family protein [Burkholderiaceae bacterium]